MSEQEKQSVTFETLAKINVNQHIEKKNGLSYLSWAWAVDQLLRNDPKAIWEYREPVRWNDTVMVFCAVTAFGKTMTAQLPVMDHRNKAISNPDAFQVNVAMQRCLAKAIALHGIGLYIYAGEDLPMDDDGGGEQKPIGTPVEALPPLKAITSEQAKRLQALSASQKGKELLDSIFEKKGIMSVDEMDAEMAGKAIAWLESKLNP